MYLVDTAIWLERLLNQENAEIVGEFLAAIPSHQLIVSDFSLHSIGVILGCLGKQDVFPDFVDDLLIQGSVALRTVPPASMDRLIQVMDAYGFDFDDAYQYVVAERSKAMIVSFDKDFDRTESGRSVPADFLDREE